MLLGSAIAFLIDGDWRGMAVTLGIAALASWFGVIHSPLPGGATFLPWNVGDARPIAIGAGYAIVAAVAAVAAAREGARGRRP